MSLHSSISSATSAPSSSSSESREISEIEQDERQAFGHVYLLKTKIMRKVANHWALVVEFQGISTWVVIEGLFDGVKLYSHYIKLSKRPEGKMVPLNKPNQFIRSDPEKIVRASYFTFTFGRLVEAVSTSMLNIAGSCAGDEKVNPDPSPVVHEDVCTKSMPNVADGDATDSADKVNPNLVVHEVTVKSGEFPDFSKGLMVSPKQLYDIAIQDIKESEYLLFKNNCQSWATKAATMLHTFYLDSMKTESIRGSVNSLIQHGC